MSRRRTKFRTRGGVFVFAALLLGLTGCGSEENSRSVEIPSRAPVASRATLVFAPAVLRIGEVTSLEIVVVTPPDHRVLPFAPPEVPGLWLLDREAHPPEIGDERWVHRTTLRVRPRELGIHEWPASSIVVENRDREQSAIELEARSLEVISILPEYPDRTSPFGLRTPEQSSEAKSFLFPVALGAGGGLLSAVLIVAGRRLWVRRAAARPDSADNPAEDLFDWADRELARAHSSAENDPRQAARLGATLLRRYAARRFGATTRASTTEELSEYKAPWIARSRWPAFLHALRALDDLRFRSASPESADPAEVRLALRALDEVEHFVDDSKPGRRSS